MEHIIALYFDTVVSLMEMNNPNSTEQRETTMNLLLIVSAMVTIIKHLSTRVSCDWLIDWLIVLTLHLTMA